MTHGDPKTPTKNPHPVKRYEVTATSEAPGPWDSIEGYISYEVINTKCVPMDSFLGEQDVPNTGLDIELTRVDDHTWRGYFYRDALQDEDYFDLGVCHWDTTGVGIAAIAKGVRFNWADMLVSLLHGSPETIYFKKGAYGDRNLVGIGAPDYSGINPEYLKSPNDFFRVTIAVKEILP